MSTMSNARTPPSWFPRWLMSYVQFDMIDIAQSLSSTSVNTYKWLAVCADQRQTDFGGWNFKCSRVFAPRFLLDAQLHEQNLRDQKVILKVTGL